MTRCHTALRLSRDAAIERRGHRDGAATRRARGAAGRPAAAATGKGRAGRGAAAGRWEGRRWAGGWRGRRGTGSSAEIPSGAGGEAARRDLPRAAGRKEAVLARAESETGRGAEESSCPLPPSPLRAVAQSPLRSSAAPEGRRPRRQGCAGRAPAAPHRCPLLLAAASRESCPQTPSSPL